MNKLFLYIFIFGFSFIIGNSVFAYDTIFNNHGLVIESSPGGSNDVVCSSFPVDYNSEVLQIRVYSASVGYDIEIAVSQNLITNQTQLQNDPSYQVWNTVSGYNYIPIDSVFLSGSQKGYFCTSQPFIGGSSSAFRKHANPLMEYFFNGNSWGYNISRTPAIVVYGITNVPVCGDGVLEFPEICDDGANNGDPLYCNNECTGTTTPICGNGVIENGEICDDGANNGDPLMCSPFCNGITVAYCGNFVKEAGEDCDQNTEDCVNCNWVYPDTAGLINMTGGGNNLYGDTLESSGYWVSSFSYFIAFIFAIFFGLALIPIMIGFAIKAFIKK